MGDRSKIEERRRHTRKHVESMRGQEPAGNIACSFCFKRYGEALAMFAGPSAVYICDECVITFADEVASRTSGERPPRRPRMKRQSLARPDLKK